MSNYAAFATIGMVTFLAFMFWDLEQVDNPKLTKRTPWPTISNWMASAAVSLVVWALILLLLSKEHGSAFVAWLRADVF